MALSFNGSNITSGRFWLTICVGITFMVLACGQWLSQENVMEVILLVMYAYFTKPRPNGTDEPTNNMPNQKPNP